MAERTASEEDLIAEAEAGDEEAQAECQSRGLSFRLNADLWSSNRELMEDRTFRSFWAM